jgi:hypothetical protein
MAMHFLIESQRGMVRMLLEMKNLFLSIVGASIALGLSSCCCLLGSKNTYTTQETYLAGYKKVKKEVVVSTDAKGGMTTQTVTDKVPVYKTRTKTQRLSCVRTYCPRKGSCGTTSEKIIKLSSAQSSVGSPGIGLVPTMKPLAP